MTTPKKVHPLDRRIAIMTAYSTGQLSGEQETSEIADTINASVRATRNALKLLDFQLNKGKVQTWNPPYEWPAMAQVQRKLRLAGLSATAATNANQTRVPVEHAEQVTNEMLAKSQGTGITAREYQTELQFQVNESMYNHVTVKELAEALGESPKMPPAYLIGRVKGIITALNRR